MKPDKLNQYGRQAPLDELKMRGHSMGSWSVARFAAKYLDVARAVILEDPGLVRPVHLEGAGHNVRRENKAQTIDVMKAFVSGT